MVVVAVAANFWADEQNINETIVYIERFFRCRMQSKHFTLGCLGVEGVKFNTLEPMYWWWARKFHWMFDDNVMICLGTSWFVDIIYFWLFLYMFVLSARRRPLVNIAGALDTWVLTRTRKFVNSKPVACISHEIWVWMMFSCQVKWPQMMVQMQWIGNTDTLVLIAEICYSSQVTTIERWTIQLANRFYRTQIDTNKLGQ